MTMKKGTLKKHEKIKGELILKAENFVRDYFSFPGGSVEYLEKQKEWRT